MKQPTWALVLIAALVLTIASGCTPPPPPIEKWEYLSFELSGDEASQWADQRCNMTREQRLYEPAGRKPNLRGVCHALEYGWELYADKWFEKAPNGIHVIITLRREK